MHQITLPNFVVPDEESGSSWRDLILQTLAVESGAAWPDRFGAALRTRLLEHGHQPIRTLSLFTGGGGLDIGFHDAGFHAAMMVELERKYVTTLETNAASGEIFEGSQIECIDIRDFIPEPDAHFDFIIGGPPCQTFSAAGRRAAGVMGTSDPRGTLFEEYVRILETIRPKGFLFENVYGIIGAQQGRAWQEIQKAFQDAGYTIFSRILDTADYGVPQHRERLFIVGLREGEYLFPRPTHGPDAVGEQPYYTAREAVAGTDTSGAKSGLGGVYGHLLEAIPPGLNYSFYTEKMGHPNPVFGWRSKFSDFLYKADPDAPVRTIKAQGGQYTGPFSWENRSFSVAEMKRLQTFPDSYAVVGNRQVAVEQIGNSVPPQMGRMLALGILDQVFGVDLPFTMQYLEENEQLGFRKRKRQLTDVYARRAEEAISRLKANGGSPLIRPSGKTSHDETRYISPEFAFTHRSSAGSTALSLHYKLSENEWLISGSLAGTERSDWHYRITVTPAQGAEWVLPAHHVVLQGQSQHDLVFAGLWKAFEEKVVEFTGVADLVQLCGYYQYAPRIRCEMVFANRPSDEFAQSLQLVVQGIGVAHQLPSENLALLLGIKAHDVLPFCERLRVLGYEARNNNTNPQIPDGEYLVPYAFPTLTPRSIQLRKNLRRGECLICICACMWTRANSFALTGRLKFSLRGQIVRRPGNDIERLQQLYPTDT